MSKQTQVFEAIMAERAYQDSIWNENTTESGGEHTVAEFLLYMQDYLTQAIHQSSHKPDPEARELALDTIRKIVSLGVCCMEQNGVVTRT